MDNVSDRMATKKSEQGREGEEDRRKDGKTTIPPTLAPPGLGQHKTAEDGSYLRRVTSVDDVARVSE